MNSLKMYCLSLSNSHYETIKNISYIPVGLGADNFGEKWVRDNINIHISDKNSFYGENTFHYWLWKNNMQNITDNEWTGFCHYRRFWLKDSVKKKFHNLKDSIIQEPSNLWKNHEIVLGNELFVNKTKLSKILKHGKKQLLKNPLIFINKNKITIKVHFDMYHGFGNLNKAIDLLNSEDREDFRNFVNSNISFNPYNMFICKSKKLLNDYYSSLFVWLESCESVFGLKPNQKYGLKRIYAFLAERYLSYWFKKNSNYTLWPIYFYDISNE